MTREEAQAILDANISPWVAELAMEVISCKPGVLRVRVPFDQRLVHSGGAVCGQVLMGVIDAGVMVAIASLSGGMRPMATVNLTTNFLRAAVETDLIVELRIVKPGRTLMFGEALIWDGGEDKLLVQASVTYALLEQRAGGGSG